MLTRIFSLSNKSLLISPYDHSQSETWDLFVEESKNGTFLLKRGYMDYHRDRFSDSSFIVYRHEKVVALLPANRYKNQIFSHQGLTYGGFLVGNNMTTPLMVDIFECLISYLRTEAVDEIVYKSIPSIYHLYPSEEDRYCLFRLGANLYRRDVLSVILSSGPAPSQSRRRRSIARASKAGLHIRSGHQDWHEFWGILVTNLSDRHAVAPVHSVEEIRVLARHFPKEIWLCTATDKDGQMLAGVVIYETKKVMLAQYIASNPSGREFGALDLIFDTLISRALFTHKHFDFGSSNEENGLVLNTGLIEHKEGFGARSIAHDFYTLKVR